MNSYEKEITKKIKNKIQQMTPDAEVILFGSHASGKVHKDSDWDILILLNQSVVNRQTEKLFRDELFEVELEIEQPISAFVFSKNDWEQKHKITPLYQNIKKEGIYL